MIVLFGVEALFVLVDMIGVLVVILVVILGCFRVVIVRTVVSKSRISVVVICLGVLWGWGSVCFLFFFACVGGLRLLFLVLTPVYISPDLASIR